MRKLNLCLDELRVDTFVTDGAAGSGAGTVHGFGHTRNNHQTCGFQNTCVPDLTCYESCFQTCKCVGTQPEVTCLYPCDTTTPI